MPPVVDGFLIPVPTASRDAYRAHAGAAAQVFRDHGATRVVECWGVDVPVGETTSHPRAVLLKDDETCVYGWIEWPDRATRDAGMEKVFADPRMADNPMPFDARRLTYGTYEVLLDTDTET